ncbi:MAG: hypothetical protein KC420_09985, partial [Myxococcales bacterium]|nr:hypothetical protein [Myxococcales bacterium]
LLALEVVTPGHLRTRWIIDPAKIPARGLRLYLRPEASSPYRTVVREAREVARIAGRHEWITPHIFDCINEADYGRSPQASTFDVLARAEAGIRPEHWPENSDGYTTGLKVIANNAEEARALTIEYLRAIEPSPGVAFHVDVTPAHTAGEHAISEGRPLARGVVRVTTHRAYNFRSQS